MDNFGAQTADERKLYFEQAAARLNLSPQIVEKDFWVCWILRRLFELKDYHEHLTFKGGTSLSKAFQIIERFSEDVDVAIERDFLGFAGDLDPEQSGIKRKEQQRRIDKLKQECQTRIKNQVLPGLERLIKKSLPAALIWKLQLDHDDPDLQSIKFEYPPAITDGLSPYFARSVKIEFGARADHFPVEQREIRPYVFKPFPDVTKDPDTTVRVLSARRTFWEKATILHMLHHLPKSKTVPARMSRHYYDINCLIEAGIAEQALQDLKILERVAVFKSVYFKAGWAKYSDAAEGAIRLNPPGRLKAQLKSDYAAMKPMFFQSAPDFDDLIRPLSELEERINSLQKGP